jgi:predicted lipid-binding transport protein (Tim44 family)
MKNKSMIGLLSLNLMSVLGITIALLVLTSSQIQTVSASPQGDAQCNPSPYTPCPPANAGQSQPPNIDPCITDPERCKPTNNSEQSQGGSQETAPASSSSGGSSSNPNQQAIDHINQAQSALENGDTEGAKMHMDAAKQALGCNKIIDPNC